MLVLSRKLSERIVTGGVNWMRVVVIDRHWIDLEFELAAQEKVSYRERLGRSGRELSLPDTPDGGSLIEKQGTFRIRMRRCDEILVGANVVLMIVEIAPGKVRLGLTAPREVPLHREEVHMAIESRSHPSGEAAGPERPVQWERDERPAL